VKGWERVQTLDGDLLTVRLEQQFSRLVSSVIGDPVDVTTTRLPATEPTIVRNAVGNEWTVLRYDLGVQTIGRSKRLSDWWNVFKAHQLPFTLSNTAGTVFQMVPYFNTVDVVSGPRGLSHWSVTPAMVGLVNGDVLYVSQKVHDVWPLHAPKRSSTSLPLRKLVLKDNMIEEQDRQLLHARARFFNSADDVGFELIL
jgi:hypothetical protein